MNKKYYGDSRYEKVWEQMQLLQIEDVSTKRQDKNETITYGNYRSKMIGQEIKQMVTCIEVASFKTGYVRNNNSGYSNYQLNKRCEGEPEYFQIKLMVITEEFGGQDL